MGLSDTIQEQRYIKLEVDHLTLEGGGGGEGEGGRGGGGERGRGRVWYRHEFVSNPFMK